MAKKLTPAAPVSVPDLRGTPPEISAQMTQLREQQLAVIEQFGGGLSYQRDHYIAEIRSEMKRSVESALEIGKRLIVMKAMESHGDWLVCLNSTSLGQDTAHRMMAAVRRFAPISNSATSRNLIESVGNTSKLFELLTLGQEDFAALAEGDEVAGIDLDDIARMTVKELRDALRDAKDNAAAKDERAEKREKEIERKDAQIRKLKREREKATPDETMTELRAIADRAALQVRADLSADGGEVGSLFNAFSELQEHGIENNADYSEIMATLCDEIERSLCQLRGSFSLRACNKAEW